MNETLERRAAYRRGASSKAKLIGIQGVAALLTEGKWCPEPESYL